MNAKERPRPLRVAVPALDKHPSSYVVRDFVRALADEGVEVVHLPRRIGSLLTKSRLRVPQITQKGNIIVPMMGPRWDILAAASLYGRPIPFCWDVWEPQWPQWSDALARSKPPLVVMTAGASARHFNLALESSVVEHLPEAVDVDRYDAGPSLSSRSIDVLEMGRRNDPWHAAVVEAAADGSVKHLYERARGEIVFKDEAALIAGLADSKISMCFPSNITHPGRSGSVSTLTSRYLESMASRCLVLGQAPRELQDLLGFDPVVEVDMSRPLTQLQSTLESIGAYQAQVDEARERVRAVGGWTLRAQQLLGLVNAL